MNITSTVNCHNIEIILLLNFQTVDFHLDLDAKLSGGQNNEIFAEVVVSEDFLLSETFNDGEGKGHCLS